MRTFEDRLRDEQETMAKRIETRLELKKINIGSGEDFIPEYNIGDWPECTECALTYGVSNENIACQQEYY